MSSPTSLIRVQELKMTQTSSPFQLVMIVRKDIFENLIGLYEQYHLSKPIQSDCSTLEQFSWRLRMLKSSGMMVIEGSSNWVRFLWIRGKLQILHPRSFVVMRGVGLWKNSELKKLVSSCPISLHHAWKWVRDSRTSSSKLEADT